MKTHAGMIALVLLLTACAAQPQTTQDYYDRVRVQTSDFDRSIEFSGVTLNVSQPEFLGIDGYAHIRSFKNKQTGKITNQLYVAIRYGETNYKRFYSASYRGGQTQDLRQFTRDVPRCRPQSIIQPCDFEEDVGLDLPDGFLEAHAQTGFQVRLNARSGATLMVNIPAQYVAAQLEAPKGF